MKLNAICVPALTSATGRLQLPNLAKIKIEKNSKQNKIENIKSIINVINVNTVAAFNILPAVAIVNQCCNTCCVQN